MRAIVSVADDVARLKNVIRMAEDVGHRALTVKGVKVTDELAMSLELAASTVQDTWKGLIASGAARPELLGGVERGVANVRMVAAAGRSSIDDATKAAWFSDRAVVQSSMAHLAGDARGAIVKLDPRIPMQQLLSVV